MATDLSLELIKARSTGAFGTHVRFFDAIASTNTEAQEWAMNGAPEGALVVADHQTGGRGRWGRTWFSAPGKLLQFSVVLRPDLEPHRHGVLTAGLGVACARAVARLTGLPARVKWPNDVVVEDRKLAGMLVESSLMGERIAVAICGIGINVGLAEAEIPEDLRGRASSIAIELARRGVAPGCDRAELLTAIVAEIESRYDALSGGDASAVLAEAAELSSVIGRHVRIRFADGSALEGIVEGFDADGALLVDPGTGPRALHVGEIEQLRAV